jgi:tetratricopeptide (TPR) repeat protein
MMKLTLHDIHVDAIDSALAKARQYRSLLEPEIAESICLDILNIDENNQQALVIYILALTDQLHHTEKQSQIKLIQKTVVRLESDYERHYFTGILNERRARFLISQPMSHSFAYDYFIEAIEAYQRAEKTSPENNDEAILRQNSCIRTIEKEKLQARLDSEDILVDRES